MRANAEQLFHAAISEKPSAASNVRQAINSWIQKIFKWERQIYRDEYQKELTRLIDSELADADPYDIISLSDIQESLSFWDLLSIDDIDMIFECKETLELDAVLEQYCVARAELVDAENPLAELSTSSPVPLSLTQLTETEPPYSLQWESIEASGESWNQRVFMSADGLGWISGGPGQALFSELEQLITRAAEQQKKSISVEVLYSNAHEHYTEARYTRLVPFPPEIEMVAILACLGWKATTESRSNCG